MIKFEDIKGQEAAKRAMLVALAGAHSITLFGPTGCGKTMLQLAKHQLAREANVVEVFNWPDTICKEVTVFHEGKRLSTPFTLTHIYVELMPLTFSDLMRPTSIAPNNFKVKLAEMSGFTSHEMKSDVEQIMKASYENNHWNARDFMVVLSLARTISNLENSPQILGHHMAEACILHSSPSSLMSIGQ